MTASAPRSGLPSEGGGSARIPRPALSARIDAALDTGGVMLIADAGYGKTSALEEALLRRRGAVAWVGCVEADSDPGRLIERLMTALAAALPGVANPSRARLVNAGDPVALSAVVAELLDDLGKLQIEPLAVVFDDAEHVAGAPGATAIVSDLLSASGPLFTVAVATRRPLALQASAAETAVLGPEDLAFTADECAAFIEAHRGGESREDEVQRLMEQTRGWPLGVTLAGEASGGGLVPEARRALFQYFDEQVLGSLDRELRTAAIYASVAPTLDRTLVESLGIPVAVLDELAERGVFVGAGDDRWGATAYHPLFREFLLERLTQEVPAVRQRKLWAQLATALESEGMDPEALDAWLAAEEWERAAAALVAIGGALATTAPETVYGFLARLPEALQTRPALQMLHGRLELGAGHFESAAELSRAAVKGFVADGAHESLVWGSRFALADALVAVGKLEELAGLAEGFERTGAESGLGAPATAVAAAAGLARLASFDEAEALLERAFVHPAAGPLVPAAPAFRGYYFDLPAGRLDSALRNVDAGIAALRREDPFGRLPYVEMFRLAILEERGEDAAALDAAARTERAARESGLAGWVGAGLRIRLAGLYARAGRLAEAERMVGDLADVWKTWGDWEIGVVRATIAGRRGDAAACLENAERALASVERWPANERLRTAAQLAPVLAASGHAARAQSALEHALAGTPPGVSTARARAVHAWLLFDQGEEVRALEVLAASWREAGDQARHLVRREWPRLEALIWAALERGALDPANAIEAAEGGCPDGSFVMRLGAHPRAEVRRAALPSMSAAGDPEVMHQLRALTEDPDAGVAAAASAARTRLAARPPPVAIRMLGGFEVRRGAWVAGDTAWERRISQRLVRLLLCHRGSAIPEDELFEAFWPARSSTTARRNLQVALSSARGVLDLPGTADSRLHTSERAYELRLLDGDWVDVDEFEQAARRSLDARGPERIGPLEEAAGLWRGEPLPEERYSDWAAPWRERLTDLYSRVLAALSAACSSEGDRAGAVDAARRAVDLDALDEEAQRRLILAYARSGRRGHALRQFLACRRALVEELGVEPAEETVRLQRRVLAGEPV